jgi:bifunctional non-homologous end joining protein LigD
MEAAHPERVVSRMARALRPGKVLIDWSQNTEHKSMVCAYSVRAKERPTISTPVTWDEVQDAVAAREPSLLVFEMRDVVQRVAERGDVFARVLTLQQRLDQIPSG